MSTIHNLQTLALDLEQRILREMQFSGDAERQIVAALATTREAFNHLETVILTAFQERNRALAAALGTGKPNPDTIEAEVKKKYVNKRAPIVLDDSDLPGRGPSIAPSNITPTEKDEDDND